MDNNLNKLTVAQFGQQIKQKFPQYQDMQDEELGSKMLTKYPQYGDKVAASATGQPLEAQVGKTGAFDIPVAGGVLRNALSSAEAYARMVGGAGFETGAGLETMAGVPGAANAQDPFLTQEDLQKFSQLKTGLPEAAGRSANFGLTLDMLNPSSLLRSGAKTVGKTTLHPIAALGDIRSSALAGKVVPTADMEQGILEGLYNSPYYRNAPKATQQAAREQISGFLDNLNPAGSGGKALEQSAQTPLNSIYKNLTPFEKMGKAYARGGDVGSGAISQGTNLVSHAIRNYVKDNSPLNARILTRSMRIMYGLKPNIPGILKTLGIGGAGAVGLGALQKLTSSTGQ